MNWVVKILVNAISVVLTASLLPGVEVKNFLTAIIIVVVLSLLNLFVKPLLIILTIPITLLTFGLFLLAINAIIILLADDLISGFKVDNFWWALLFSIVLSVINSLLGLLDSSKP